RPHPHLHPFPTRRSSDLERDPANTDWQRDLAVSHNKIGDALVEGDPGELAAYRQGLVISEALAARDPANTQWQTDVAVSCFKLRDRKSTRLNSSHVSISY